MNTVIPCAECDTKRRQLEDLGFKVLGCTPIPERPNFCLIEFTDGASPGAGAPVGTFAAAAPITGLLPTQVATAQAIVNIFETGSVRGDYGGVTLIAGDTGHLTFGRAQTTLGSGNLAKLLQQYCANPGAVFSARITPFLPRFMAGDLTLDHEDKLHNVLRASADDPVMRETQDGFFDTTYWQPAQKAALKLGIVSPLGVAVVYDSWVHGSFALIRDRTTGKLGAPDVAGERPWISEYVAQRRQWLATHTRDDLRATVYRMDAFQRLLGNGMWSLPLPLVVRAQEISTVSLAALPPGCYDGPAPGTRAIALQTPLMRGLDVRRVQLALSDRGVNLHADGIFGQTSMKLVQDFQRAQKMLVTGMFDPASVVSLIG